MPPSASIAGFVSVTQFRFGETRSLLFLVAANRDETYERAALRWAAHFLLEVPAVTIEEAELVLAALATLDRFDRDGAAQEALSALCRRHAVMPHWRGTPNPVPGHSYTSGAIIESGRFPHGGTRVDCLGFEHRRSPGIRVEENFASHDFGLPGVRWEEESEDDDEDTFAQWGTGAAPDADDSAEMPAAAPSGSLAMALALAAERKTILEMDIHPWWKRRLLESNRRAIVNATGGRVFATENVVYALIAFSALVIVVLAALTAFWNLPKEVTLTFVGTVVGGLVATIAQKIGRL
jgi:hypothetical protein